jgi:hypothetical protein
MRRFAIVLCAALAACATQPADEAKTPAPAAAPEAPAAPAQPPPPREPPAREVPQPAAEPKPAKGTQLVAQGVKSYEDGDYRSASKQFEAALHETLAPPERASAHKYLAFIACASKRLATCRGEFRKAFAADPAFDLTPAEAGHPTWGPAFRGVKAEVAAKAKAKATPKAAPKAGPKAATKATPQATPKATPKATPAQ